MSAVGTKLLFEVRRLSSLDANDYRGLRLDGLQAHPEAFGASWEEEAAQPLGWFADRLNRNVIFGASQRSTSVLEGIVGFYVPDSPKQRSRKQATSLVYCVARF